MALNISKCNHLMTLDFKGLMICVYDDDNDDDDDDDDHNKT